MLVQTEIKRKGKGFQKMTDKYWIYWSGGKDKDLALVVKDDKVTCIRNEKLINERMLLVNINGRGGNRKFMLIVARGPNKAARK